MNVSFLAPTAASIVVGLSEGVVLAGTTMPDRTKLG
jgi:hypothetical protein